MECYKTKESGDQRRGKDEQEECGEEIPDSSDLVTNMTEAI